MSKSLIRDARATRTMNAGLFLIVCFFPFLSASARAEAKLLRPIHETQSLIINNNNFSAADFYSAYISKEITERRYAEMYLLGVMDSSEGISWCSYKTVKTITIDEAIYTEFKKLDSERMKIRASLVINEILSSKFRCGEKR